MSDDKSSVQKPTEEQTVASEQPTGNQQEIADENKNPEVSSQSEKKQKDFEKATHKYRTLFKESKQENEELKKQIQEASSSSTLDSEKLAELIREINALKHEVSPLRQIIEKQTESQVLDELASMPYSNELADHVKSEFDKLPSNMDFRSRIMTARANAIANNLDIIIQANREVAKEEAYSNQEYKSNKTLGERTVNNSSNSSLLERLKSGKLTTKEYYENRDEIQRLQREELGL